MRTCLKYPVRLRGCVVLVFLWFQFEILSAIFIDNAEIGFSASASDGVFLYSLNSTFSVSFHNISEMVYLCVMHTASKRIVWTANRDHPASMADSLSFTEDGISILMHGNSSNVVWSSNLVGKHAKTMQMRETGNLVLLDASKNVLWQSFDYPTDTLLTGQVLKTSMSLVNNISDSDMSSGPFSLSLQAGDLYLVFSPTSGSPVPYWRMEKDPRLVTVANSAPTYMLLNSTSLNLVSNNSQVVSSLTWKSDASLCRVTLQADGNLGVYVFSEVWTRVFVSITEACSLPLHCGSLGLCSSARCSCPDSLQPLNNNTNLGCQRPSLAPCTNESSAVPYYQKIGDGLDYFANDYVTPQRTTGLDACKESCNQNCSCNSFFFYNDSGYCYLFSELGSIQTSNSAGHTLYIRTTAPTLIPVSPGHKSHSYFTPIIAVVGGASFIIVLVSIVCYYRKVYKMSKNYCTEEEEILDISGLPTKFSYKDLQYATKDFSDKVGSGGFGSVYEGCLPDNTKVAVKQLEFARHGRKQFQAEVATIGSVHHVNLVHLHGFCAEGIHKLLVYEFMENGSLDKFLFPTGEYDSFLDWSTRYSIALGTARGLAYLHDDCREKIIHCDIKPENILLDEDFNAKISDFGLAKLLAKEESQMFTTTMRGTRGYLAPEWLTRLPVSDKSDVYSFGMVLLEIISGRRNYVPVNGTSSSVSYFPAYVCEQSEEGHFDKLVDERLDRNTVKYEELVRMVKISLLCIQKDVLLRPSMANVVKMLEGSVDVTLPPISQLQYRMLHEADLHFNQMAS